MTLARVARRAFTALFALSTLLVQVALLASCARAFLGRGYDSSGAQNANAAAVPLDGEWVGGTDALDGWKFVQARFAKKGSEYEGTLDVPTADAMRLPLAKISTSPSAVSFEIATPFGTFFFDGKRTGNTISGSLTSPAGARSNLHLVRAATVASKDFDRYVGVYEGQPDQSIFVTYRPFNQLAITITTKSGSTEEISRVLMLAPSGADSFFTSGSVVRSPDANEILTFVRNDKGEVASLTWQRPNGSKTTARRLEAPFKQERVVIQSEGETLGGTLLLPPGDGPHPAVVIVHGSGPITRDNVNLFLRGVQFVRMGLAVLLYDKRGTGSPGGEWDASYNDLAGDALAGLRYLQTRAEIDPKRIGLQGNSHAGWVIPVAVSQSKDVAFAIVVSGGGISQPDAESYETEAYLRANKFSDAEATEALNFIKLKWSYGLTGEGWDAYQAAAGKAQAQKWFSVINGPLVKDAKYWEPYRTNKAYEPVSFIAKMRTPLLLLFAEPDRDRNLPVTKAVTEWQRGLKQSGNKDYTVAIITGVGHGVFFREEQGKTVLAMEPFGVIEDWLAKHFPLKVSAND